MHCEPNLVVMADDDSDDTLFLLTALLSMRRDFSVIVVRTGDRLLELLESVSPRFIFMDINMPRMNGFETLQHIRSNKDLAQPTVIMCSTSNSADDIRRSQELGADIYFTKPTKMKYLDTILEEIFKRKWEGKANEKIPETSLMSYFHEPASQQSYPKSCLHEPSGSVS